MLLHRFGHGIGDAEGVGEYGASVRKQGVGEVVVLSGEVILARELGGDGDQQSTFFADSREGSLPGFELGHAVGAPASAKEKDDERADAEQVRRMDQSCVSGGRIGEGGRCGVGQIEGWGGSADGKDMVFDAGEEEGLHGLIGDGQAAGLNERASLRGDVVELGLEVGGMRHPLKCRCTSATRD